MTKGSEVKLSVQYKDTKYEKKTQPTEISCKKKKKKTL